MEQILYNIEHHPSVNRVKIRDSTTATHNHNHRSSHSHNHDNKQMSLRENSTESSGEDEVHYGSKSPFFKPSSTYRNDSSVQQQYVVVQQATPRGTHVYSRSIHTATRSEGGGQQISSSGSESTLEHKSTILGACSNLVNAIVGCGIVGIPYALRQSGFVAGIVLIVVAAIITENSLRLLINTAKHVHVSTYETAMEAVFGVAGFRWIACSMFIVAYGGMISYLMIVKDTFSSVLDIDSVEVRRSILLVLSCFVALPLSCKRDMADLAFTSRISVIIDTFLVGIIVFTSPTLKDTQKFENNSITDPTFLDSLWELLRTDTIQVDTIFIGLGVLSFAFVCQHSAFIIAGSLSKPTAKRWSYVTQSAVCLCTVLTMLCGITGYIGYRENTAGNILLNLNPNSIVTKIAKLSVGTSMLFVYPLDSFVSRHVFIVLFFQGRAAHEGDDAAILNRRDRRYILTLALFAVAVIPAALCENLGTVLAITGAVGGSCLSYIGPGILYLGVHGEEFIQRSNALFWGNHDNRLTTTTKSENDHFIGEKQGENGGEGYHEFVHEATPLNTLSPPSESQSSSKLSNMYLLFEFTLKQIVWYCIGMPIWCGIARHGIGGLQTHIHDMALKSPYPIRIGDVEYKRVMVNLLPAPSHPPRRENKEDFDDDKDEENPSRLNGPLRTTVFSVKKNSNQIESMQYDVQKIAFQDLALVGGMNVSGIGNINQQIGKNLLEKKNQMKKGNDSKANKSACTPNMNDNVDVEPDPQEHTPTWFDFVVAIFFIEFGVLAMMAGIVSLFYSR